MPYIDAYSWVDFKVEPNAGENYQAFRSRVITALTTLDSTCTPEMAEQKAKDAWSAYVLKHASEVTVTLEREVSVYNDSEYWFEGYYGDWKVKEIHGGAITSLGMMTYATDIATAGGGDVFKIAKSKEDEQLVFGWANIAIDETGQFPLDWDGDITTPEHLEKAAYNFVLKYRATGEQHQGEIKGDLVESVMFTKEKQAAMGIPEGVVPEGWWVGFHIPDKEVFAKIKSGEYEMFSVEGTAKRAPLQD